MSIFKKIIRCFGGNKKEEILPVVKEESLPVIEVRERTQEQMQTLGESFEGFFGSLKELEELYPCPCGNLFLCRHKVCPECGAVNPKYKEFTDEDQRRAESRVRAAHHEFHAVRKNL